MAPLVPVCGSVVLWVNAALTGADPIDDVVDEILRAGAAREVASAAGDGGREGWAMVIGRLRRAGVPALRLLLPAPGDLSELPGPPDVNRVAAAAGECALTTGGAGLLIVPDDAHWQMLAAAAARPVPGSLGEATRALAQATVEGAETLERLGLARGRDWAEVQLAVADAELGALVVPDRTPERAVTLIERGTRLLAAVRSATATDGAAVTAREADERRAALAPLARAARRALESGFSAPLG